MRFGRGRAACAPTLRAGDPWACHGTLARGAGAVGSPADDGTDQARALVALAERFVDPPAALYALRCLVGVACRHTGETPRSILEAEFVNAPSDEVWRATVGRRV